MRVLSRVLGFVASREDDDSFGGGDESASKKAVALEVTLNANAALAYLKVKQWAEAAQRSTAALKKEPVGCLIVLCVTIRLF
jgi:hypothetical protein